MWTWSRKRIAACSASNSVVGIGSVGSVAAALVAADVASLSWW